MIRIVLSASTVKNGERVKGSVTYEGAKTPRKLEVVCRWRIEGRGRGREEVIGSEESQSTAMPFEFDIPREGPLSYDGQLLRIIWEVAANADLPMALDEHAVEPFTVVARKWDPAEWVVEEEEEEVEDEDEIEEEEP